MEFRNCLNFIFSSLIIFSFLKCVPCLCNIFTLISTILIGMQIAKWLMSVTRKYFFYKIVSPENKAVLITGCDTGFGNALARHMDRMGYKVFAACLYPEENGAKELMSECSENLIVLPLNVRDDRSIEEAKEIVTKNLGHNDLWAIVNNAGIGQISEIDWTSLEYLQAVYDTNAGGTLRVIKAFLPFIKRAKGRIVNMNSYAGRFVLPCSVGYSMSKSATISLSDGLRIELRKWGVKVIGIEPFFYSTNITATKTSLELIEKTWRNADEDVKEQYGEKYKESFKENVARLLSYVCNSKIHEVVDCMIDAITADEPLPIYTSDDFKFKILHNLIPYIPIAIYDYIQESVILKGLKPAVLMSKKFHKD